MDTQDKQPEWAIGSIVAFNSHFYNNINDTDIVYLSGDPQLISPLMIITEALKETKAAFDENTGDQLVQKGSYQYKCMWYSQKNHQFEDAWITGRLLKLIEIFEYNEDTIKAVKAFGTNVEFRTSNIELGKKKSTLKQTGDLSNGKNYSITAQLSFVSPIMQVVGSSKSESKEPLFHPKTNDRIRFLSKTLIKCKYYNPSLDKISEVLIPVEALVKLEDVKNITDKIKEVILLKQHIVTEKTDLKGVTIKRLLKPEKVYFRNGRYFLQAFDYLNGQHINENVNSLGKISMKKKYFSIKLPEFTIVGGKVKVTLITKDEINKLLASIGADHKLYIHYEDFNEKETFRTIKESIIIEAENQEKDSAGKFTDVIYLKAKCGLRDADRFFRIDRIKSLKVLNFKDDIIDGIA